MKESIVISRKSTQYKFIALQSIAILLVAFILVAFSDIKLPFLNNRSSTLPQDIITATNPSTKENTKQLRRLEKSLEEKEARIIELEDQLKTAQNAKNNNTTNADEAVNELKALLQRTESESKRLIADKDTRIRQLEQQVQTLQNNRPSNTSTSETALLNKLRSDVQKLETRNALLEKLNSDLKKNNEYLSTKLKENE